MKSTKEVFLEKLESIAGTDVFLSKRQVANLFGIGLSTLERKMKDLKRIKLTDSKKSVRFTREDLISYFDSKIGFNSYIENKEQGKWIMALFL